MQGIVVLVCLASKTLYLLYITSIFRFSQQDKNCCHALHQMQDTLNGLFQQALQQRGCQQQYRDFR